MALAINESRMYHQPLEKTERNLEGEQEKINLARGLKKFNIDGKEVWALNEERARKKAMR